MLREERTTKRDAIAEAAENLRRFLDEHQAGHDLKGDFALLRNAAELWARAKDRERE